MDSGNAGRGGRRHPRDAPTIGSATPPSWYKGRRAPTQFARRGGVAIATRILVEAVSHRLGDTDILRTLDLTIEAGSFADFAAAFYAEQALGDVPVL